MQRLEGHSAATGRSLCSNKGCLPAGTPPACLVWAKLRVAHRTPHRQTATAMTFFFRTCHNCPDVSRWCTQTHPTTKCCHTPTATQANCHCHNFFRTCHYCPDVSRWHTQNPPHNKVLPRTWMVCVFYVNDNAVLRRPLSTLAAAKCTLTVSHVRWYTV